MDPAFQVTHSFSLASQNAPPSYHFGTVFANSNVSKINAIDKRTHLRIILISSCCKEALAMMET